MNLNIYKIVEDNGKIKFIIHNDVKKFISQTILDSELAKLSDLNELKHNFLELYQKFKSNTPEIGSEGVELFLISISIQNKSLDLEFKINKNNFKLVKDDIYSPIVAEYLNINYLEKLKNICLTILEKSNTDYLTSQKILLNVSAIIKFNKEIYIKVDSDLDKNTFKDHFISMRCNKKDMKSYEVDNFRPCIRNTFYELYEYAEYLINIVANQSSLLKMKEPIIFEISIFSDGTANIEFKEEFITILNEYLSNSEIEYFMSELNIIMKDIFEELDYIINIINKSSEKNY